MSFIFFHIPGGYFDRFRKTNNSRDVFRASPFVSFMVPAVLKRSYLHAFSKIQSAYAFGAVNLMARKRAEVNPEFFHVYRHLSENLYPVCMKIYLIFSRYFGYFFYRLHCAGLIISKHDRYQDSVLSNRVFQFIKINYSILIYRKIRDIETQLFFYESSMF